MHPRTHTTHTPQPHVERTTGLSAWLLAMPIARWWTKSCAAILRHTNVAVHRFAGAVAEFVGEVTADVARVRRLRHGSERGQTTAEYALIILGAAAIATLVITWATNSSAISRLFDIVIDRIIP